MRAQLICVEHLEVGHIVRDRSSGMLWTVKDIQECMRSFAVYAIDIDGSQDRNFVPFDTLVEIWHE